MEQLITIRKHTITLIKIENNYKHHGTGVLMVLKDKYLLVTAGHVLDDLEKLFIPLENGKIMFKPGGKLITNSVIEDRENDFIDIGVLILDRNSVKALKTSYQFLKEEQIIINHNFLVQDDYLIFGFPSTWSKKSYTRKSYHIRPFCNLTNPVNVSEYSKYKRKSYLNIIVNYNRKQTLNTKSKTLSFGPDLFGMSGCGLWDISNFPLVHLVAIMTDWPKENRSKIIGVRMDIVTELLRKQYHLNLPESNLFKLS
ncbi:hypothetical protein KO500_08075 [Cellulophaga baltica]|uniref:hypothetical protein n=1 Tax=Cellulophaga TaxID=104264 RepID=UPI001C07EE12|nr:MULTISPECIES: hypothetical protein [Cellulophaga]MBU2996388.1 hypothetical protein [Cellulophaga baltica]MDO6767784.1 hypothetical protein [Cellulophaga sp. 1_MG-2023]